MQIQITSRHYHASPALHENLREQIDRMARFNDSLLGAHIILDAHNAGSHKAEIIAKILDKTVVVHAEEDTMGKAIDSMLEKLERQLKRENEKLKVHKSVPMSALAG